MDNEKAAFIGSGIIGSGLAVLSLLSGRPTVLQTRSRVEKAKERVKTALDTLTEAGVCTAGQAALAAERAVYTTSIPEAVRGAGFIQESGPDAPDAKRALIAQIEAACDPDAVIASSTSMRLPSELQEGSLHPARILAGHPYHPSYLLPLVELCGGDETAPETIERAAAFYRSLGKYPIVCRREVKGFLVNRLSWAALREARSAVLEGCCTVEEMDKAIMYGPGLRMALAGQILAVGLGVEGGVRAQPLKYGRTPTPDDEALALGTEAEMAARPPELGNTEAQIERFRDLAIADILRIQGML